MAKVLTNSDYNVMDRKGLQTDNTISDHHVIQRISGFTIIECVP